MNLILKGRGVDLDDRLKEYATEKLTRAERFFDRIIKMEVQLSQERNPRVKDDHRVEVTVKTPRDTLRAEGAGGDYFAAIDQAARRLERQIKRFKQRLNNRSRGSVRTPEPAMVESEVSPSGSEDDELEIVRASQPIAKPMTPEEAILELESRNMQFMLFTNAETMDAGVVYRRTDGAYGLIEHES